MRNPERILVCGGRDFVDASQIWGELDTIHRDARHDCMVVIQGGAQGADRIAREWCASRLVQFRNYPALWDTHGRAAGPIRNRRMLEDGRPELVLAFNGGRGTANMVRQAREAGVPVRIVPPHFGALNPLLTNVASSEAHAAQVERESSRDEPLPPPSTSQGSES